MSNPFKSITTAKSMAYRWSQLRIGVKIGRNALSSTVHDKSHSVGGFPLQPSREFHRAAAASKTPQNTSNDGDEDDDSDLLDLDDDSDYDSDEEAYSSPHEDLPWKSLLELSARASWRASDPNPPDAVLRARAGVLTAGGASAKQIRQCYANVVASHKALALRRERERRRLINRSQYTRSARLRDEEIHPVFYGRLETLASLKNRLKPNYAITKRVLEETRSLLGGQWKPKRVIDMGIGVGSASAAALELFRDDIEWIHGVDSSRCMRECSKSFLEEVMEETTTSRINPPRLTLSGSIATESSSSTFDLALMAYTATELPQLASTLAAAAILWQKLAPDGVFVLVEPGTPDGFNTIRAVRNMLLDCCPPLDIKINEDVESGVDQCHIIAPCTHNGPCPMERYQRDSLRQKQTMTQMDFPQQEQEENDMQEDDEWEQDFRQLSEEGGATPSKKPRADMSDETELLGGRFCSFVQTMSTGSHLKRGEKFSYLVAQKRNPGGAKKMDNHALPFQNVHVRDLLANVYDANEDPQEGDEKALEAQRNQVQDLFEEAEALEAKYLDSDNDELGLELLQGDANRSSFGRIIRAPMKKKGHVYIDYCGTPGRLMRTRITKSLDYGVAPGIYTAARKSRWGGLWPDVAPVLEPPMKETDEENKKSRN